MIRTPDLAPKYACFWVPLWFNKLDFKSYLKNVYNVDVLHVRSYVQQSKVDRKELAGRPQGQGAWFRPPARKKMTVELVDPFIFPEQAKDLSPYVYHDNCVAYGLVRLADSNLQMGL
jgi:large subunit ribosomal protein L23